MLKIFSTQISGLFKKIIEQEDIHIEDAARLLSQAAIGEGTIYLYGSQEMQGIVDEALSGVEPFPKAKKLDKIHTLTSADRILLFSRNASDPEILEIAKGLVNNHIPFVTVATVTPETKPSLLDITDVHINLHVQKGLIPDDVGNRYGFPTLMMALFAYYGIKFTLEEILQEYAEDY